jgi:DNA invertase Pin-like site-specific DNA recombinase
MDSPTFTVRGYGRASTDRQVDSPVFQEKTVTTAFELYRSIKPGWDKAQWGGFYVDPPTQRDTMLRERQVGSMLLASTMAGDVIMASHFDRIFANTLDACETIELIEQRKFRLCILDMDLDISTAMGQAVFKIIAAIKELEVKEIRRRCRENAKARIDAGRPQGKCPVGWKHIAIKRNGKVCKWFVPDYEFREHMDELAIKKQREGLSTWHLFHWLTKKGKLHPKWQRPWSLSQLYETLTKRSKHYPLSNGKTEAPPIPPDAEGVDFDILRRDGG